MSNIVVELLKSYIVLKFLKSEIVVELFPKSAIVVQFLKSEIVVKFLKLDTWFDTKLSLSNAIAYCCEQYFLVYFSRCTDATPIDTS